MHRSRVGLLVLVAALVIGASARLSAAKDVGAPGSVWESEKGAPAWAETLPAKPESIQVAFASQSNLLRLAEMRGVDRLGGAIRLEAIWRLRPLLGEAADAIPESVFAVPTVTHKAYHLTPPERGRELVVGGQTYTVWNLCEIPSAPVLAAIPEAKREDAKKALASVEPADAPKWETPSTPPRWSVEPTAAADMMPVVVHFAADRVDVAKAQAATLAGEHVGWSIVEPLREPLGGEAAWKIGSTATTWRRLVARAVVEDGPRVTAWALYEVPIARAVAAAPESSRASVKALLDAKRAAVVAKGGR